jgi:coenzyme PQQ precursor peptide PqqA
LRFSFATLGEKSMKLEWQQPQVKEEEVGLEVTSYLSAELDES